jgi:uncharacterized protein YodC (DUF2158 family)
MKFDRISVAGEMEFIMSAFTNRSSIALALVLGVAFSAPLSIPAFSQSSRDTGVESQTSASFQRGDLVRLRSGGPAMTVNSVKGNQVDCSWAGLGGDLNAQSFPSDLLQRL